MNLFTKKVENPLLEIGGFTKRLEDFANAQDLIIADEQDRVKEIQTNIQSIEQEARESRNFVDVLRSVRTGDFTPTE